MVLQTKRNLDIGIEERWSENGGGKSMHGIAFWELAFNLLGFWFNETKTKQILGLMIFILNLVFYIPFE